MKTTSKPTKTAPAHLARPASKAAFVPHAPYSDAAMKTMRTLVKDVQDARTGNAKTHSYSAYPHYDGAELKPCVGRLDATHALTLPSRTNNRLHYPDGRITDMAGNSLKETWSKA
ncbi:hypothetical protein RCH06_001834 [Polaromonas sp. CG_9.5]|uniref:hypothetical protein n=1 Tax=Polaromonas sp. CG_9.5 TaxID=3071705 RepID=UPI002E031B91|nr:hypothetical protein [Polaromonas sp. CG_9.5]